MNITVEELQALSGKTGDLMVRIAQLENENERLRSQLGQQAKEGCQPNSGEGRKESEELLMKDMLLLSWERIGVFQQRVKTFEQWAVLRLFVEWTLPEARRGEQLDRLDKTMPLPEEQRQIMVNGATFESMYQISGNQQVKLGGTNNE